MKSIKYLILVILMAFLPISLPAQSSGGDRLYNEAVALMEKGNRTSLNKAITTFKKAKLSYVSADGKKKCDAMIAECQKRLKKDKADPKQSQADALSKEARTKFDAAISFKGQGDFVNALKYFKEARDLFQAKDSDAIAFCNSQILLCENPLSFKTPNINIPCQGNTDEVEVSMISPEEWNVMQPDANWIHPTKTPSGITLLTDPNETTQTREAQVTIRSANYSACLVVKQYGQMIYKIDGEDDSVFYLKFKNNDKDKLLVSGIVAPDNIEWRILSDSTSEWIFIDQNSRSFGVSVSKNNGKDSRKGRIALSYTIDNCENITYIPVYQGNKAPRKGWSSPKDFFTEK